MTQSTRWFCTCLAIGLLAAAPLRAEEQDALLELPAPPEAVSESEGNATESDDLLDVTPGPGVRPEVEQAASAAASRFEDRDEQRPVYTLSGMVGQVNGRPIYARTVFEPIEGSLAALGRQHARNAFRREAARLIAAELDQIVTDALVLGAAERDLSEEERRGLRQMLGHRRAELVRKHGHGSPALAEATLRERAGIGLQATLDVYRQEVLVARYLRERLIPRINVTRRDIRRHYHDNHEQFNPPGRRTLEVIRVREAQEAERIAEVFADGADFGDTGANVQRLDAPGEAPLAHDALNEALAELAVGERTGPIEAGDAWWFIRVESHDKPKSRTLRDVQVQIEELLQNQQFRRLSEQHRRELYEQGSYNPIDQMTESLLAIAMSRYAPEQ